MTDELLIRTESARDVAAVRRVLTAAFPAPRAGSEPVEAELVDELRASPEWIPALSVVAEEAGTGEIVGYVVCTRAWLDPDGAGGAAADRPIPVLGLGPLAVRPDRQRAGAGTSLMTAVLARAEDRGEELVALLGHKDYYPRFGFRPARELGVAAPDPSWGDYFQALRLPRRPGRPAAPAPADPLYRAVTFRYAAAFTNL